MGMNILSEEVKNELITISEQSATPDANFEGIKDTTTRSAQTAQTKTLDCSKLDGYLRTAFVEFKNSDDFDPDAIYDCSNMSTEKKIFKPMVLK